MREVDRPSWVSRPAGVVIAIRITRTRIGTGVFSSKVTHRSGGIAFDMSWMEVIPNLVARARVAQLLERVGIGREICSRSIHLHGRVFTKNACQPAIGSAFVPAAERVRLIVANSEFGPGRRYLESRRVLSRS